MLYYLAVVTGIYVTFLAAQRADRRARQAFAGRLAALYRARGEFWRLRAWAQEAHDRGDAEVRARFHEQAAALVPGITGESTALRRDYPRYAEEIGWTAGMLDDELAEMGRSLASADLRDCERWITGRGRPSVDSVLNPAPRLDDDVLTARIHMAVGIVVGAAGGFVAWLGIYWGDMDARLSTMALFILLGAAVLGHVAYGAKDQLWSGLSAGMRHRWWADSL
jgi:hypothetical protein